MLAPEMPVMQGVEIAKLRMERKKTLFGIYENEETLDDERSEQVQIRRDSKLSQIPVLEAVRQLYAHAVEISESNEKVHTIDSFQAAVRAMFDSVGVAPPSPAVVAHLFNTFSSGIGHGYGQVPLLSVETAVVLLSRGSTAEKIEAIFRIADLDRDGSLSVEELYVFFRLIFTNVTTRSVLGIMNANGVPFASPDQLARTTALECMRMCDMDGNGLLSLEEFTAWFHRPRLAPVVPHSPFVDPAASPK